MIVNIGDLVHVKIHIHDFTLLEGIGVIMEKGDPDCCINEGMSNNTWLIFCENDYWHVDQKHFTILPSGSNTHKKYRIETSFAKKIRNIYKSIYSPTKDPLKILRSPN